MKSCSIIYADICPTQCLPVHRVITHGASNRDTHLYPPHNISSVHLTTTTTYVRRSGRITNGMRSGRTTPQDSGFSSPTPTATLPDWPSQEEPGSGLTASEPVSDVSDPACTNGVWPPLRPVSVAQKYKPSTMLSSTVQSIDPPRTKRPDGSGRWDNRMAAQRLSRYLGLAQTKEEERNQSNVGQCVFFSGIYRCNAATTFKSRNINTRLMYCNAKSWCNRTVVPKFCWPKHTAIQLLSRVSS